MKAVKSGASFISPDEVARRLRSVSEMRDLVRKLRGGMRPATEVEFLADLARLSGKPVQRPACDPSSSG